MNDQAQVLRSLVRQEELASAACDGPPPCLVAISGGKGGVGTTTLTVNIAASMSRQGRRVVLVDADFPCGDVAPFCNLEGQYTVADVLENDTSIHDALQAGPAGVHVLTGIWAPREPKQYSSDAYRRFIRQLQSLGSIAEFVLVDCGSGPGQLATELWKSADKIITVTTSDAVSIMDTYATIKLLSTSHTASRLHVIVNQAPDADVANDVHRRLRQSCERFLGQTVILSGYVPSEPVLSSDVKSRVPGVLQSPTSRGCRLIERVAASLTCTRALQHVRSVG